MGYLCATCGGVGGLFESSHAHSDKDSCIAELKAEKAKLKLQNRELAEAKGNLLDFVLCVRLWAIGQPTGKNIKESCDRVLDHYAEKPQHEVTCDMRDPATQSLGCNCTVKRNDELTPEMPFTREELERLKSFPHPPELDRPNPADKDL